MDRRRDSKIGTRQYSRSGRVTRTLLIFRGGTWSRNSGTGRLRGRRDGLRHLYRIAADVVT